MQDGKKPVMVVLDADLMDRFDALCRKRRQERACAIEATMRRSLKRQARSEQQAEQDPLDPDWMILDAKGLREVPRKLARDKHDPLADPDLITETSRAEPILLALATEIALKAWQCRDREAGDHEHCHDLVELFDGLSDDARKRLEDRLPEGPSPLGANHSELSGEPFGGGMRTVLEFHRDTFKSWRYSYEALSKREALYTWPPQLDEALTAIIETYIETYHGPARPPPSVLGNRARLRKDA